MDNHLRRGVRVDLKSIHLGNLLTERRLTRDTIAALLDGDVQFRPTGEQMSFGAQALHMISAQETLLEAFQTGDWKWQRGVDLASYPTLDDILRKFDEMHATELAFYENLEQPEMLRPIKTGWGPVEPLLQLATSFLLHEAHHRGQLVAYLRLKGMTPPKY